MSTSTRSTKIKGGRSRGGEGRTLTPSKRETLSTLTTSTLLSRKYCAKKNFFFWLRKKKLKEPLLISSFHRLECILRDCDRLRSLIKRLTREWLLSRKISSLPGRGSDYVMSQACQARVLIIWRLKLARQGFWFWSNDISSLPGQENKRDQE